MNTQELLEKFATYCDSPENIARKQLWEGEDTENFHNERWRGRSATKAGTYTMSLDISGYSPLLNINCADYYSTAEANLHEQLRYGIWDMENIPGGRYFEKTVFCSVAGAFEPSLFGAKIHFLPKQAPWFDEKNSLLKDPADLLRLKPFDFETSGLMPLVREMYEHHAKLAEPFGIKPEFPVIGRSPFSVALMLRGFEDLLMDMMDEPEFFHDLMSFIVQYQKDYVLARKNYLGEDTLPGLLLFNDEISSTVLSDAMYREFIFPYEKELAEFFGGVQYWHSCGQSTAFYESVAQLPGLKLMHVGPWSDVAKAAEVFGKKDISIEICRNDVRDMYEKTPEQMEADLRNIKNICDGKVKYQVRLDGIAVLQTVDQMLEKVSEWRDAADRVFR